MSSSSLSASSTSSSDSNISTVYNRSSTSSPIDNKLTHEEIKHITQHNLRKNDISDNQSPFIQFIARNQFNGSVLLLSILFLLHQFIPNQQITLKFLHLQYKYPNSIYYDIGFDDVFFVITWVVALMFIRSFLLEWILGPIGCKLLNIKNKKALERYKEQGWPLFYYTCSFSFGFYIYYHSDYFMNCDNIWIGWPHDKLSHSMKMYYLVQLLFCYQLVIVLNIEEKRKDHVQMFSHHIITCLLVDGSYYYYFTRIGHVILVLMDFVDIFLPLAKMLKYTGFTVVCDLMFVVFLVSWIVLRHGFYNYLLYHATFNATNMMDANCGKFVDIIPKRCYTDGSIDFFLILLGMIQILSIIWLYLILKVFYRVISGNGADDVRSDDEEEEEDDEEEKN